MSPDRLFGLDVTLVSTDGVHVFYSQDNLSQQVPIGDYHAHRVRLRVLDKGQIWMMDFSSSARTGSTASVESDVWRNTRR